MTRPLEGIKVLELAEQGFVPSSCAVLADWGADVVKVERLEGDPLRQIMRQGFLADTGDFNFIVELCNRNKRGVSIDLRHPSGRAAFDRLVEWADVFVTNFLPSARQKLRITPDDLFAVNPKLVYAKGHGQGQRGAEADAGGFDSVSFWMRGAVGHMLTPEGGPLVMQRAGQGDIPTGMFLAGGIAAGLFHRERTGRGTVVDVSLLAGAVWTMGPDLTAASILGTDPPKIDTRARPNPLVGAYFTRDARWVQLTMMDSDRWWSTAATALGLDDLATDGSLSTEDGRRVRAVELRDRFAAAFASMDLAEVSERLTRHGCIWAKMNNAVEAVADPQVIANDYMPRHPNHERARLAASPVQFDDEPVAVHRRAPQTGEHTREVLRSVGLSASAIDELVDQGAIRVE